MLREYLENAINKAIFEKLEDGSYTGKIPFCPGVVAFGQTLYECQEELCSILDGWMLVKIRHGDRLPVINNIDLNPKVERELVYA